MSDLAGEDAGAGYVFDFDGAQWVETGQIAPVAPVLRGGFGRSVAIRGNVAVVGQPKSNIAFLYQLTPSGWEMVQEIRPPASLVAFAEFGNAVALTDDWLFVAARYDRTVSHNAGAVYVYRREPGGGATFTQRLDGRPAPERFGTSIDIDGGTLAVGAPTASRIKEQGAVYLFELDGDRWALRQSVTHDNPYDKDYLGVDLDLAGDTLIAGAENKRTGIGIGVAYIFTRQPGGDWTQAAELDPMKQTGPFGAAVATDGRWAVVGAPDETVFGVEFTGAAYIYDLDCVLACRADLDGDGELTFFDFLAFGNLFAAGDKRADFDGSGALDFFDFLAFQTAFAAGCP